jgi:hypothetical protein
MYHRERAARFPSALGSPERLAKNRHSYLNSHLICMFHLNRWRALLRFSNVIFLLRYAIHGHRTFVRFRVCQKSLRRREREWNL